MIGLIILTFVPALAALMFWLRARTEQRGRLAAEARLAELENREPTNDGPAAQLAARRRRLLGVVAHELRSPVSAILGYQELLAEGILGSLDERGAEAASRIRHAANQILNLTDGMYELAHAVDAVHVETGPADLREILAAVLRHAETEGAGRGVTLLAEPTDELPRITTDADRLRRTLDLLVAAAIKASPGATLHMRTHLDDGTITIHIDGTGIDPERDAPDPDAPGSFTTGAGLRIAMARAGADAIGARLTASTDAGQTRLSITLPRADAAPDTRPLPR